MKKNFSVCILSNSFVASDPRILKQVNTFLNMGMIVVVIGYGEFPNKHPNLTYKSIPTNSTPKVNRTIIEKIVRGLKSPIVIAKALQWQIEKRKNLILLLIAKIIASAYMKLYWSQQEVISLTEIAANTGCDFFHANDIQTLPSALKAANGKPVIFDAHEYAPYELDLTWQGRYLINPYKAYLCLRFIPLATSMTTVCEGIARLYAQKTSVKPVVIRNVPPYQSLPFRLTNPEHIRIIHHGGAMEERRLEDMIEVISVLPKNYSLTLMLVDVNNGAYLNKLKLLADAKAQGRVFFKPPVPYAQLVQTLNDFDIGIFLLGTTNNINYFYALPNKLFEFIMAGLCVAIGPSVEMKSIIEEHNCGVVSNTFSPQDLASNIQNMTIQQIDQFKVNSLKAAKELNAEREMEVLVQIYQDLISHIFTE